MSVETRNSVKFKVSGFPSTIEPSCRSFVQINQASSASDLTGVPQAYFNSMDTIKRFGSDIVFFKKFALISMTNCYANSEPIVLEFDRIISKKPQSDSLDFIESNKKSKNKSRKCRRIFACERQGNNFPAFKHCSLLL